MNIEIENKDNWPLIVKESGFRVKTICVEFGFNTTRFRKWVCGDIKPNKRTYSRFLEAIKKMAEVKKHQYHPSFGYASPEEFRHLTQLKEGKEKRKLMQEIEWRTANKGMVK